jgi:flagellar hook-associated protein 1
MLSLSIAASALTVNQQLLDLTGQNIANANTAGYHRQVADLAARTNGGLIGAGVDLTQINRLVDTLVEQTMNRSSSTSANLSAQLATLSQVQTVLSPTNGSLNDLLQNFFNQADQLSSQPADLTQRSVFLSAASSLTDGINGLDKAIGDFQDGLTSQMQDAVDTVNQIAPQIASLNEQIQRFTLKGSQPNDLMDQRDQLISQLASILNVQTVTEDHGQVGVIAGGNPIVLGNISSRLELYTDPIQKTPAVRVVGSAAPLSITDGQLAGLLTMRNQTLPSLNQQLNNLTTQLVRGIDEIHATSIPLNGSLTILSGQHAVTSSTVPLAQSDLTFAPQAGTLYVSVTNNATGVHTLTSVAIDPATQSLQDIATALSGVPNIQAVVNSQTHTLQVLAKPGFSFDFSGQLPTAPDTSSITGTSTAQLAGAYTGSSNDQYSFKVVGNGTVGVTANLSLEVRDKSGSLLGTFNIGQGYVPNSALSTVNGVSVKMSSGSVNDGDSFSTAVVADPDSGGLLSALGLNSFFQGDSAANVSVRSDLIADPSKLALSSTGASADGGALERIDAFRAAPVLAGGTQSVEQYLAGLVGGVGSQVQDVTQRQSAQQVIDQRLQAEQQSTSGVDANEELVKLMQFQRAFQAAAHYVSVIDETLAALVQIT